MADSPGQEASLKARRSSTDRISSLPDALIHGVLSFLPTKEAVATSSLSKRWVSLWTLVPTLHFQDSFRCTYVEETEMKFVHFVYRVLLLNKAGSVEKFRLNCYPVYGHSCINTWICSAIERAFQEVDISVRLSSLEIPNPDFVKLPSPLFLIKTLKILKLRGEIMIDVPVSVCLPCLKILHLDSVNYGNVESVSCLISGCQCLEELLIDATTGQEYMVNFSISTPTLTSLSLALHFYGGFNEFLNLKHGFINISAPSLKYLNFNHVAFHPEKHFFEIFPCLTEASISVGSFLFGATTKFFRALNSVKCLKLSGRPLPLWWDWEEEHDSFPLFADLTRLELVNPEREFHLSPFLLNSPQLETFVVHQRTVPSNGYNQLRWRKPKHLPECFSSSLTRVCFENFQGLKDEMKTVRYFLRKARVLRTMEIHTGDLSSDSKRCSLEKISRFPRSSKTCQLSFN